MIRRNSQDDFSKELDYQPSTMVTESPLHEGKGDFRDEYQINNRGPIKLSRPMSNQQLHH